MLQKKIKSLRFLLLLISMSIRQAKSFPGDVSSRNEPLDQQIESSDDSVSIFVKTSDSNFNEFEGFPIGVFDPKLLDSFRKQSFQDDTNDATIFREDFVNQHPTNLEQNKIPFQEFEDGENEADNIHGHLSSHFERINTHEKKNRNNFGQVINLGSNNFRRQPQIENLNPVVNQFQGFGHNLKEFQLFDQENSLPQYEFNGDQILSPTTKVNEAAFSSPTSFHNQNQIHSSPKNSKSFSGKTDIIPPANVKAAPVHRKEINTQDRKNFETQVIPAILEAKVIPGVLMNQFVDVPTAVNDPLLSIYNSPNYINQRAPSKRLVIPATDLNALPVFPPFVNNQTPSKRHLDSNYFVRDFERNRVQQSRDFSSNNVHITGGFTPTFIGRNPSLPDIISSASRGRSLRNDNSFTESRAQFVPGVLERGFIPSNFLLLSSFQN